MNKIKFDSPLQGGSVIQFIIGDTLYPGIIASDTKGLYYVESMQGKYFENNVCRKISHEDFVMNVFKPLNRLPEDYYRNVLGKCCRGLWPETPLEDLRKVLLQMKKDYEKQVEPSIDFSKFRFRIGDTILYKEDHYRIVGYYFSEGFNNFNGRFGYVIEGYSSGHNGSMFGYNEYGVKLHESRDIDKYYIYEGNADSYFEEQSILNNQSKTKENGNEIKLQRTKAVISRGTVPTGYRIRCKVNKATVSSQSLSYTEITC